MNIDDQVAHYLKNIFLSCHNVYSTKTVKNGKGLLQIELSFMSDNHTQGTNDNGEFGDNS